MKKFQRQLIPPIYIFPCLVFSKTSFKLFCIQKFLNLLFKYLWIINLFVGLNQKLLLRFRAEFQVEAWFENWTSDPDQNLNSIAEARLQNNESCNPLRPLKTASTILYVSATNAAKVNGSLALTSKFPQQYRQQHFFLQWFLNEIMES